MYKKLTLRIDETIIDNAKTYADNHNQSLSKLVESFFVNLTSGKDKSAKKPGRIKISPGIKELTGILNIPENVDYKKDYRQYMERKYK